MATVKIHSKGQIVIPAKMRKKYIIQPGSELNIMEYGDIMYLVPPVDGPIRSACGSLPKKPSLSNMILKERKKDFK